MRERFETKTDNEFIELIQDLFNEKEERKKLLNYIEQNNEPNRAINLKLQFHNLLNLTLPK